MVLWPNLGLQVSVFSKGAWLPSLSHTGLAFSSSDTTFRVDVIQPSPARCVACAARGAVRVAAHLYKFRKMPYFY